MVVRWTRKMLVLALAALGVQYLRVIVRVIVAELRPRSVPARNDRTARYTGNGARPVPRRLVISTLESNGEAL